MSTEVVTNTIGFSDIRKGDKIRLTQISKVDGSEVVSTGVAASRDGSGYTSFAWRSEYGTLLAKSWVSVDWSETIDLLERPEPKEYVVIRLNADDSYGDIETELLTKTEALEQGNRTGRKAVKLVGLDD